MSQVSSSGDHERWRNHQSLVGTVAVSSAHPSCQTPNAMGFIFLIDTFFLCSVLIHILASFAFSHFVFISQIHPQVPQIKKHSVIGTNWTIHASEGSSKGCHCLGRIKEQQQRQELADAPWALKKIRAKLWKRSSPNMFVSNLTLQLSRNSLEGLCYT